jgi:uncharacterized protein YbjT (DUF2867 family)
VRGKVLILGADGFIGRHLCFAFRQAGWQVTASARRVERLEQMGFVTLKADLTDPLTHDPAFWRDHLDGSALINAAGLLNASEAAFEAVHVRAPTAAYQALQGKAVLISAVGIEAETPFARWRRHGEAAATAHGVSVLRPGLVEGETSYGGSSLLRALAAFPVRTPVIGDGQQRFNPVRVEELAKAVMEALDTPRTEPVDIGGAKTLTQIEMLRAYRRWLGLPEQKALKLPERLAMILGRVGDVLKLGPISATSVRQMKDGVVAGSTGAQGLSDYLARRPAGTQDLWQARLYLLKPVIRLTLALMWLVSGMLGLLLPVSAFPDEIARLPTVLARAGGLLDMLLAAALLANWRPRLTGWLQLAMVGGYTLALSVIAPALWLAPFGELLKNVPVLTLILVHLALSEER